MTGKEPAPSSQVTSEAFRLCALSQPWHPPEHAMAVCGLFRHLHAALCGGIDAEGRKVLAESQVLAAC